MRIGPGFGDIQQKFLFRLQSKGEDLASKEAVDKEKGNAVKNAFEDLGIGWKLLNWCSKIATWSSVGYFEKKISSAWDKAQNQFLEQAPGKLQELHDGVVKLLEEEPDRPVTEDLVNRLRNGPLQGSDLTQADYIRIGALQESALKAVAGSPGGSLRKSVLSEAKAPSQKPVRSVKQVHEELEILRVSDADIHLRIGMRDLQNKAVILKRKVPDLLAKAKSETALRKKGLPLSWHSQQALEEKIKEGEEVLALFADRKLEGTAKEQRNARALALLEGVEGASAFGDERLKQEVTNRHKSAVVLGDRLILEEMLQNCLAEEVLPTYVDDAVSAAAQWLGTPVSDQSISLEEWEQQLGTQAFQGHLEAILTCSRLDYLGFSEDDIARVLLRQLPESQQIQKILITRPVLITKTEWGLKKEGLTVKERAELRDIEGLLDSGNNEKILEGIQRWCTYFEESYEEITTVPLEEILDYVALQANFPRDELERLEKLQYTLKSMDSTDTGLVLQKLQEGFVEGSTEYNVIQGLLNEDDLGTPAELMPLLLKKMAPGELAGQLEKAVQDVAKERSEWAARFAEVETLQNILKSMGPSDTQPILRRLQASFESAADISEIKVLQESGAGTETSAMTLGTGIKTPAAILPQLLGKISTQKLIDKLRMCVVNLEKTKEILNELARLGLSSDQINQAVVNLVHGEYRVSLLFTRLQQIMPLCSQSTEELSEQVTKFKEDAGGLKELKTALALAKWGNSQPLDSEEKTLIQPYLKQAEETAGMVVRNFLTPESFLSSLQKVTWASLRPSASRDLTISKAGGIINELRRFGLSQKEIAGKVWQFMTGGQQTRFGTQERSMENLRKFLGPEGFLECLRASCISSAGMPELLKEKPLVKEEVKNLTSGKSREFADSVVGLALIVIAEPRDQQKYIDILIKETSLTKQDFDDLLTDMGKDPSAITLLDKAAIAHQVLAPTAQLLNAYQSLSPADQAAVKDVFAKPYLVGTKSKAVQAFFQAMIALQEKEGPKALHVWQNQCLSEIRSPSWTKRLGQEAEVPEGFSEKSAPDRFWTQFGGTLLQKEPAASRKKLGVYLAQDLLLVKRYNSVTLGSTDLQTLDSLAKLIRTLDSLSTEEKNQIREMMRTPPTEQQLFSPIGKKLGDLYVAARESVLGFTEEQKATGSAGKITNTPLTSTQITSLFGEDADIVEGIKKDQLGIEQALQGGRERCYKTLTPQFAGKIEEKFQGTKDQVRNASFPNETGKSVRGVTDIPELPTVLSTQDYGRSKTPIIIEIEGGEPFELPRGFQTAGKSKDENFAEFLHFLKKQNLSPEVFARVVWSMEQTFRAIFQDTFTEQLRGETHFDVAAVPREAGNKFIIKNDGSVDIIYAHHFQATYADRAKTSRYAFEGGIEPANKNFVQVSVTPGGQGGASFADFKVLAADSSQATKFSDEIDKMMASPAMEEVDSEADQLAIAVIETSSTLVRDRGQEAPQVLAHVMEGFSKTQGCTYRFQGLQGKLEARLCRLKESRREALLEKNNAMENLFFLTGVSKEKQEGQLSAEGAKTLYEGTKEKQEWNKVLAQHKILSEKDEEIRKYEQALQAFQAEATQAQAATTLEGFAKLPSVNSAYKLLGIPEGQEPFTLEELVGAIPDAELKIVESRLGEISSSIKPSVEKSQTQEQVGAATMMRLKKCGITDQQILPYIKSKVLLGKVSVEFERLHGKKTPEEQMQVLRKFKGEDVVSRSFVALGVVADIKEQYDALGAAGQEQLKDFISGRALTEDDRGTPAWKAFNEIQKRVKGSDIWDSRGNSKIVISTDEGLSAVIKKARDIDFAGQMVGLVLGDACVEAAEQMQGKLESVYKERKASLVEAVPMIKGVEPALVEQVPSIVFSEYSREGQPLFLEMGDKKLPFEKGFNGDEDGNFELLGQFFDFFKNDPNLLSRLSLCLVQYIPNLLGNPVPEEIQKEIDMTGWCATEAEITGKRIVMDPTGGSVAVFYQGKVFAKDSMTRQKLATQEGVLKISLKKDGEGNWGYDKVEVFGTDSDDYQVLAGLVAQATQESASVEGSDMFAGLQARQQELVPEFNNDFLTGEAIETATIGDLTVPGNLEEIQRWNMPISLEGGEPLLLSQGFQGKKEAVESFCDALQKTLPEAQIEHIFYALGSFPEEILLDPMPVIEDSPPSLERESVRIVPEEGGVSVYVLYRPTIGGEPRDPVLTKMTISGEGADCKFTNWEIISNEGEDANLYAQMPKPIVKE